MTLSPIMLLFAVLDCLVFREQKSGLNVSWAAAKLFLTTLRNDCLQPFFSLRVYCQSGLTVPNVRVSKVNLLYSLANLCISQIFGMAISLLTKAPMFPFLCNFFFFIRHPIRCLVTWLSAFRIHLYWVIALTLYFLYLPLCTFLNLSEWKLVKLSCRVQGVINSPKGPSWLPCIASLWLHTAPHYSEWKKKK